MAGESLADSLHVWSEHRRDKRRSPECAPALGLVHDQSSARRPDIDEFFKQTQRRHVTVLFADRKSPMELLAAGIPETHYGW
jgi:hypothetical protein